VIASEELPFDETLPDFRRLKLPDDGSGTGYFDVLHGSLLADCPLHYKEAFRFGQGVAGAFWQIG
jgi:hypothetical protein